MPSRQAANGGGPGREGFQVGEWAWCCFRSVREGWIQPNPPLSWRCGYRRGPVWCPAVGFSGLELPLALMPFPNASKRMPSWGQALSDLQLPCWHGMLWESVCVFVHLPTVGAWLLWTCACQLSVCTGNMYVSEECVRLVCISVWVHQCVCVSYFQEFVQCVGLFESFIHSVSESAIFQWCESMTRFLIMWIFACICVCEYII